MPIAPRPAAETAGPALPKVRVCIMFSLAINLVPYPASGLGQAGAERSSWESRSWLGSPAARQYEGMQRDQLADFLRRRRAAIRPGEVGLLDGPRRRTTGLRREEVAMLAGMSVDYVVRLEQGRSSQPSTQLLGALARALRLTEDERDHLFRLARAGLLRMLDLLGDTPAMVVADLGEVLPQIRLSMLLTGSHDGLTGDRRYLAYRWFTEPVARVGHLPEERDRHTRQLVADLRA